MFLVKLKAVLHALGILDITFGMQRMVWRVLVPQQDASRVMATVQAAIGEILNRSVTPHTASYFPPRLLSNLVPGPDFDASTPPAFHESDVASLYWTISIVVWAYLRSDFVKSHFLSSYVSHLPPPHRVISLAHSYVSRRRKPDIAALHGIICQAVASNC